MAVGDASVDGGWIEMTRTLKPRLFSAVRYDRQLARWINQPDKTSRREVYARVETTLGFRMSPELTLRASYLTRKGYVVFFWDDQFLASVVYARKVK